MLSGVLEVDGSSRYFFIIVTFTIGDEVLALPVEDGAGDNFTIAADCVVVDVVVIVVVDGVCVLLIVVLVCTLDEPLPIERLLAPLLSSLIKLLLFLVLILLDL